MKTHVCPVLVDSVSVSSWVPCLPNSEDHVPPGIPHLSVSSFTGFLNSGERDLMETSHLDSFSMQCLAVQLCVCSNLLTRQVCLMMPGQGAEL